MAFDLDDEELEATRRLNGVGSMSEEDILNEIDFCLAGEYITIEHRQAIEGLLKMYQQEKEKNNKAIEYIDRWEINSIGTPFSYTAPGKELLKILKGEE